MRLRCLRRPRIVSSHASTRLPTVPGFGFIFSPGALSIPRVPVRPLFAVLRGFDAHPVMQDGRQIATGLDAPPPPPQPSPPLCFALAVKQIPHGCLRVRVRGRGRVRHARTNVRL
ncbi:hypothetical protein PLESTM_000303000 [Pleodorina starrii]|nr:hypothetical protein PLESTM_000303000 [Pleodorina starrii]